MKFIGCSPQALSWQKIIQETFSVDGKKDFPYVKNFDICPYEIYLLGDDFLSPVSQSNNEMSKENTAADCADEKVVIKFLDGTMQQDVEKETGSIVFGSNQFRKITAGFRNPIYKLPTYSDTDKFLIFLKNSRYANIPIRELTFLRNYWLLESQYFPLHSSAVIRNDGVYLFCGPSGAGKSTIARLSKMIGGSILDDDQVIIKKTVGGKFNAQAWKQVKKYGDIPIKAFFWLVKDEVDRIDVIAARKMTQFAFEQSSLVFGGNIPNEFLHDYFHRVADFSKVIPGYELHFRKSPDFWELIDAEIPCE